MIDFTHWRDRLFVAITAIQLVSWTSGPGVAGDLSKKPVVSLLERRTANVVMQKWDNSCGAAAVATVLQYGFQDATPERTAALFMLRDGDPKKIKQQGGFSFLDLKHFAEAKGYKALAYKDADFNYLRTLRYVIVPIIEYGRNPHFIVLRSVLSDGALDIADPAFGNRTLSARDFMKIWKSNVVLVVGKNDGP
jgi:hypothetical protein